MKKTTLQIPAGFDRWLPALCLLFTVATSTALVSGDFTYDINNPDTNTVTITDYTGAGGAVVIPSTIDSKSVTHIGVSAFSGQNTITDILIPDSVVLIESTAFSDCNNLAGVIIGNSVTSIHYTAFNNCLSLVTITVAGDNPAYSDIDGILFNKDQSAILQYPGGKTGYYTIPDSVTSIRARAFSSCIGLTNITIPDSVASIGSSAFEDCTALTGAVIGNGVTNIWESAFQHCTSLINITIPDSVTFIGNLAFAGCSDLTSVTIGNGITTIPFFAFFSCNSLPGVTIPDNITSVGSSAFKNCSVLVDVYFQGDAPVPGSGAFGNTGQAPVYYRLGTIGWEATYSGRPTALWNPLIQIDDGNFGVQSNSFGFSIAGSSNEFVKVKACTNLVDGIWEPLATSNLTGGSLYFSDSGYTNHPTRFYHLDMP